MTVCGAKKRKGGICTRPAGWGTEHPGEGRCKLHSGSSPRGANSPHFKTGLYSKYASASIQSKNDDFIAADPLDLTSELALARALLAEFLSRYADGIKLDVLGIDVLSQLIGNVRRTIETISKIKNESALTAAEITYLQVRAAEVAIKYFPNEPNKQEQFVIDLFGSDSTTATRYFEFIEGEATRLNTDV